MLTLYSWISLGLCPCEEQVSSQCYFPSRCVWVVWWASGLLKQLLLILQDYIEGHSAHYQFVPTQKLKAFLPDDIVENYNK